jgi:hydroxyacylglutathione hydrolase
MIVERLWAANSLRNYHYLIACPETGEALAVDPLEWQLCLDAATARGWTITQILNTHEHHDHTGGNAELVRATGARVLAHAAGAAKIGGVDTGLHAGDVVRVGRAVELECLDTPGHTMAHICLLSHTDSPALFSGDTLFNAGVGNCKNGGDPEQLYDTCAHQLARLPARTHVYPGHDYLQNNLGFSLHVEPGNPTAIQWRDRAATDNGPQAPVLTLHEEREVNPFFRLQQPELIDGLRSIDASVSARPSPREVFLTLRELRNSW